MDLNKGSYEITALGLHFGTLTVHKARNTHRYILSELNSLIENGAYEISNESKYHAFVKIAMPEYQFKSRKFSNYQDMVKFMNMFNLNLPDAPNILNIK